MNDVSSGHKAAISQLRNELAAVSARLAQVTTENENLKAENGTLHDTVRLAAIPITRHLTAKAEIRRLTDALARALANQKGERA